MEAKLNFLSTLRIKYFWDTAFAPYVLVCVFCFNEIRKFEVLDMGLDGCEVKKKEDKNHE